MLGVSWLFYPFFLVNEREFHTPGNESWWRRQKAEILVAKDTRDKLDYFTNSSRRDDDC